MGRGAAPGLQDLPISPPSDSFRRPASSSSRGFKRAFLILLPCHTASLLRVAVAVMNFSGGSSACGSCSPLAGLPQGVTGAGTADRILPSPPP